MHWKPESRRKYFRSSDETGKSWARYLPIGYTKYSFAWNLQQFEFDRVIPVK